MTTLFRILLLSLLSTVLSAASNTPLSLAGIWEQDGYSRILHVEQEIYTVYYTCAVSCTRGEVFTKEQFLTEYSVHEVTEDRLEIRAGINRYTFKKIDLLPQLCRQQDDALKKNPAYNFETLWHTYQENYCYFEEREIDWQAIGDRYRVRINDHTTALELFLIMEEMIKELDDSHSFLVVPDELEAAYQARQDSLQAARLATRNEDGTKKKRIGINIDKTLDELTRYYIPKPRTYNSGIVKWGRINEETGYVQINEMTNIANYDPSGRKKNASFERQYAKMEARSKTPLADQISGVHYVMKKVMADLSQAPAIIIDLRFNGGGYDEVALAFLSYFSDSKEVLAIKKAWLNPGFTPEVPLTLPPVAEVYQGKVFFLTSYFTASAAEIFMLGSIRAIPEAVRIGSPTEGIFSDILGRYLPNGWNFGLSNEVYLSPDGINYENKGILPHHEIDYKKSKYWFLHKLKVELPTGDEAVNKALEVLANSQ